MHCYIFARARTHTHTQTNGTYNTDFTVSQRSDPKLYASEAATMYADKSSIQ